MRPPVASGGIFLLEALLGHRRRRPAAAPGASAATRPVPSASGPWLPCPTVMAPGRGLRPRTCADALRDGGHGGTGKHLVGELDGRLERWVAEELDRLAHAGRRRHRRMLGDPARTARQRFAARDRRRAACPMRACSATKRSASAVPAAAAPRRPGRRRGRFDQRVVDPGRECWIVGPVGQPAVRRAAHAPMGAADDVHGLVDLGHRAVRGRRHVVRRPRQPAQRILAVAGVIRHTGHHLGMRGLDEQGPDAADEARDIAHHLPGHRLRAEQARVAAIFHRPGHGVVGLDEQVHACGPRWSAAAARAATGRERITSGAKRPKRTRVRGSSSCVDRPREASHAACHARGAGLELGDGGGEVALGSDVFPEGRKALCRRFDVDSQRPGSCRAGRTRCCCSWSGSGPAPGPCGPTSGSTSQRMPLRYERIAGLFQRRTWLAAVASSSRRRWT